jgi:hypothetical protein
MPVDLQFDQSSASTVPAARAIRLVSVLRFWLAPRLTLPVWLAWTRGDQFVSWGRARAAVSSMPRHHMTLFRGGHRAFLEDPEAFAFAFEAFAADVRGLRRRGLQEPCDHQDASETGSRPAGRLRPSGQSMAKPTPPG